MLENSKTGIHLYGFCNKPQLKDSAIKINFRLYRTDLDFKK